MDGYYFTNKGKCSAFAKWINSQFSDIGKGFGRGQGDVTTGWSDPVQEMTGNQGPESPGTPTGRWYIPELPDGELAEFPGKQDLVTVFNPTHKDGTPWEVPDA